ncbi:DUF2064 domain-containing protein [uncultured Maribacter sp.]|uniref:TIGR04282 family arsenosugar biosynthesis glycosyltransferase n=1 Tax=uncultured Maribacter sp. TaxID=431308 RepID=UPI002639F6A7|nr:DUF2064 domain-containing protein [uncultured Maribacter sp.]
MNSGELSEKLTANSIRKAEAANLDCILYTEKQQKGNTFGQRFSNAMSSVFALGYDNVIVIGNDTPQLQSKHIKEAHQRLQQNQPTIGPSLDGGFYLLAISKDQFKAKTFQTFDWQTNKIFSQVHQYITIELNADQIQNTIHCISTFYDLDNITRVKKVLAQLGASFKLISACLQKLIEASILIVRNSQNLNATYFLACFYNKGSPSCIH